MTRKTPSLSQTFQVSDYDLAATLDSGQVFRWTPVDGGWQGVIDGRWVQLKAEEDCIIATAAEPTSDWAWLESFLQVHTDIDSVIETFPDDEPMRRAVSTCRGLRLLKQNPWECLASFILSSTKQISQIRKVVARVCERYGERIKCPEKLAPAFAFPTPERIASCTERQLRDCRMGFRAPYLLAAAKAVSNNEIKLNELATLSIDETRSELMRLPGVGRKIADCVLLFTGAQPEAFPVDVWIMKALQKLYFPRRKKSLKQLQEFSEKHFGSQAGYAQQYLFHYMRIHHSNAND